LQAAADDDGTIRSLVTRVRDGLAAGPDPGPTSTSPQGRRRGSRHGRDFQGRDRLTADRAGAARQDETPPKTHTEREDLGALLAELDQLIGLIP